jgi:hypothetical protein
MVLAALVLAALASAPPSFARLGDEVVATLRARWYVAGLGWRGCEARRCGAGATDWGADSLTGIVYERWLLTRDPATVPWMRALFVLAPDHREDRGMLSDVPLWDAIAALRAYDVTHDARALRLAQDDYAYVARDPSFARGACAGIDYQYPQPGAGAPAGGGLKTLESDANRVLAGALLARRSGDPAVRHAYLADARRLYALLRARFRDPRTRLYTVYAFDDGRTCAVLAGRFFASVNGVMIEAGLALADATGDARYVRDARATARAVQHLADARGVFADLQAENDLVAPLVLAMSELAQRGDAFARGWILRNAAAAAHARGASGAYGRFFDGPPPARDSATVFQTGGGFALLVAAGALAPYGQPERDDPWRAATTRTLRLRVPPAATFTFVGSGIALFGMLGERCVGAYRGDPMCEGGHARVAIDGRETTDRTGIWQGKVVTGTQPGGILFAWRWRRAGRHVLHFTGGLPNAKEGGPFLDVASVTTIP